MEFQPVVIDQLTQKIAALEEDNRHLQERLEEAIGQTNTAVEVQTNFLDIISHELRTPLNAVTGHVNMLRNTSLDSEQAQLVRSIIQNGDKLTQIFTNLLEYAQANSNHFQLFPQPFDLEELLQSATTKFKSIINDRPITLTWHIKPDSPTILYGDSVRIRQILNFLLDNATKYTEEGFIHIHSEIVSLNDGNLSLEVSVEDSGVGIQQKYRKQLFQKFSQSDTTHTRKFGGLGLGLATAKKICNHMGGSLDYTNRVENGSIFTFSVQVKHSSAPPRKSVDLNNISLRDKRLLVVGRDVDYRRMISQESKLAGMFPYVASSDSEALYWLKKESFDIICIENALLNSCPQLPHAIKELSNYEDAPLILISDKPPLTEIQKPFTTVLSIPFSSTKLFDIFTKSLHHASSLGLDSPSSPPVDFKGTEKQQLTVLIVDDNIINQKVAQQMLIQLGHKVSFAANGQTAVEQVKGGNFDAVLMDIQMPVMDGITATKKIVDLGNKIKQPRIIAATAFAREGDKERFLSAGMHAYLSKPIRIEELITALNGIKFDRTESKSSHDETKDIIPQSGIDLGILEELFGNEINEFLAEMAPLFLNDSEQAIFTIKSALPVEDIKTIQETAHAMKGASANLGMSYLSYLCGNLEQMMHEQTLEGADSLFKKIRIEHNLVIQALHELCR